MIHQIEKAVKMAKANPEWRDSYMIYQLKQQEAELRGVEKGRAKEKKDNVKNLLRVGVTEELIASALNMPLSEVNAIKAQLAN